MKTKLYNFTFKVLTLPLVLLIVFIISLDYKNPNKWYMIKDTFKSWWKTW